MANTTSEGDKVIAQILQKSLIPTFVIDNNHIITHWNIACERLTGVTAGEMIGTGKQWLAVYTEEKPVMVDLIADKVAKEVVIRRFWQWSSKIHLY